MLTFDTLLYTFDSMSWTMDGYVVSTELVGAILIPGAGLVHTVVNLLIPGVGIVSIEIEADTETAGGSLVWDFNYFLNSP